MYVQMYTCVIPLGRRGAANCQAIYMQGILDTLYHVSFGGALVSELLIAGAV